jgi:Protein of unknown function (DUF2852)
MRYEHAAAGQEQSGSGHRFNRDGDYFAWAKTPGFNPYKLLAVIAGLAIFPPLGIAALVYFIWSSRRHGGHWRGEHAMGRGCGHRGRMNRTGNAAFDEHREKVLSELEAERQAFAEHRAEQRRKRDQEAFDAFQAKRKDDKPSDAQE